MPLSTENREKQNPQNHAFRRRLTAVLSIDAQDYSRLMEQDETRTVGTIKTYRELLTAIIDYNQGRVVDATGDNLLAAFPSAVDAVRSALRIQDEIRQFQQAVPENEKMLLRIGINLGDVIVDRDRIYGDGVNIAARLESLAPGGGICISGNVYEQIRNKLDFGCTYLGLRSIKNITQPVRVYEIQAGADAGECKIPPPFKPQRNRMKAVIAAIACLAILGIVSAVGLKLIAAPSSSTLPPTSIASPPVKRDQASIAVLPFTSINPDGPRHYLADGITNDIITDLSKFRNLSVTASNLVYQFKDKAVDVTEIGRRLNVAYILEGSLQADDRNIRVNAQLIDTQSGRHLWANRYDRNIGDILPLQNDLVQTIVRKLSLNIDQTERRRALAKKNVNLDAYDNYLRGLHHIYRRSREGMAAAKAAFKSAIRMDPRFGSAYLGLAEVRMLDAAYGYTEFPSEAMQEAETLLKQALSLDSGNTEAMAKLAYVYMRRGAFDLATSEAGKALHFNPNDWRVYRVMAPVLLYSGKPDEALKWYQASLEFDPYVTPGLYMNIAICHYLQNRYDQAIQWLTRGTGKWPDFLGHHIVLASLYGNTGDIPKAQSEVAHIRRISPFFELQFYGKAFRNPEHREKIVSGLRRAGVN